MKNACISICFALLLMFLASSAHADLDGFLSGLNNTARSDPNDYGVRLSVQFGVPQPQVFTLIRSVATPADAFMCYQLAQMLHLPPERIVQTYNANRGRGWGVIAKELGIKPGSAEFHALKRGDFALTGSSGGSYGKSNAQAEYSGQGQGNGKGQGKGKGHNK
jgi:hypothetical protein